jgi:hypothetical protein
VEALRSRSIEGGGEQRDQRLERELEGVAGTLCRRSFFGTRDAVGSLGSKAQSGLDGSMEPRMSEVFRDPRCQRSLRGGRFRRSV